MNVSVLLANLGPLERFLDTAKAVSDAGIPRVWVAETRGPDALVTAALIASRHELEVGTAIVPVWSRTPAVLSMAAADIVAAGDGRPFHLGIGAGGQAIIERWHGMGFAGSATRVADVIAILRQALAGERTDHDGERARSNGFRLTDPPGVDRVPIYIGGMGERMLHMAGAVADGLILTWIPLREVPVRAAALREAADSAGRDATPRLVARVYAAVTDAVDEVREHVRQELVEYVASPPYGRYFASIGYGDEVEAVAAAFAAGDREASLRAISDRLLDEVLVVGDGATVRERVAAYADAGATDVMVQPVPLERAGDPGATIAALAR